MHVQAGSFGKTSQVGTRPNQRDPDAGARSLIRSTRGLVLLLGVLTLVRGSWSVKFPARLAVQWFAPRPKLLSVAFSGTAWSGSAGEASVAGTLSSRACNGSIQPLRLFTRAPLPTTVSATPVSGFVDAQRQRRPRRHASALTDLQCRPAAWRCLPRHQRHTRAAEGNGSFAV